MTNSFSTRKNNFADLADSLLEASILGSFSNFGYLVRSKLYGWQDIYPVAPDRLNATQEKDDTKLTAVVTGFSSGIGLTTAIELAKHNWQIIGIASNKERCINAMEAINSVQQERPEQKSAPKDSFVCDASSKKSSLEKFTSNANYAIVADVAELSQIDEAVKIIKNHSSQIDLLIHCAGKIYPKICLTEDGFESTLALHVLGPHLLTNGLLDIMPQQSDDYLPRVIWVSSGGMYAAKLELDRLLYPYKYPYRAATAYAYAKRLQVDLVEIWAIKLAKSGRLAFSMHPGFVNTRAIQEGIPIFTKIMKPLLRTARQGADTLIYLSLLTENDTLKKLNGSFLLDRKPRSTFKLKSTLSSVSQKISTFETIEDIISNRAESG